MAIVLFCSHCANVLSVHDAANPASIESIADGSGWKHDGNSDRWRCPNHVLQPGLRERIYKILSDELDRARDEYARVNRVQFDLLVHGDLNGLPSPDGQHAIAQSGKPVRYAFAEQEKAAKRYRDFVEHGVIPDDLLGETK